MIPEPQEILTLHAGLPTFHTQIEPTVNPSSSQFRGLEGFFVETESAEGLGGFTTSSPHAVNDIIKNAAIAATVKK